MVNTRHLLKDGQFVCHEYSTADSENVAETTVSYDTSVSSVCSGLTVTDEKTSTINRTVMPAKRAALTGDRRLVLTQCCDWS